MKIGIVGWGLEGQSAFNFFGSQHQYLIVNEHPRDDFPAPSGKIKLQYLKADRPIGMVSNVADLSYLEGIDACDKIIYSPTSYKNLQATFGKSKNFWAKTTTVQNLFFENVKTKNIIGVTGTKGKGTTCTLIAKILEASGKKVHLGGNVGTSMLNLLKAVQKDDWVVLELSNFQLHNFACSPHIAVCLMIVAEHLDWHPTMAEYVKAKANLFKHQKTGDIAIYFPENKFSTRITKASPGTKIPYFKKPGAYVRDDGMIVVGKEGIEIVNSADVKLPGRHNLHNICAAITASWQVAQNPQAIKKVLTSFTGLEHRLELVRELDGVKYYDDSFGTTPETAIVAMQAFDQPKVVILGGSDKGVPFDKLADAVANSNVRQVILIGEVAGHLGILLKNRNFTKIVTGLSKMPVIVAATRIAAQPGDVVLLSTGCASFGLFRDYKDRGNQFKRAVNTLA